MYEKYDLLIKPINDDEAVIISAFSNKRDNGIYSVMPIYAQNICEEIEETLIIDRGFIYYVGKRSAIKIQLYLIINYLI